MDPAPSNPLARRRIARRDALLLAGAAGLGGVLLGACGGNGDDGGDDGGTAAGSIQEIQANAAQLSLLAAQSELATGAGLFTFGLSTADNQLINEGEPKVWLAKDQTSQPVGPVTGRWHLMDAYDKFGDTSPRSPLRGFYAAEVDLPSAGNWLVAAEVTNAEGQRAVGSGAVKVVAEATVAAPGSKALPVKTPVATGEQARAKICTREPPCDLHRVSLDKAFASGKPTAISFGTPLLCSSRMCGPVLDELLAVAEKAGDRANFVHLEIYPERDTSKPTKPFLEWGFQTEPWTVVVDADGVIRSRQEGPTVASLIEANLRPLL